MSAQSNKEITQAVDHEKNRLKIRCRKTHGKSGNVILVPSRLAGKVRSIDCHVITGITGHMYVYTDKDEQSVGTCNLVTSLRRIVVTYYLDLNCRCK